MLLFRLTLFALLAVLSTTSWTQAQSRQQLTGTQLTNYEPWETSYSEVVEKSKQSRRPILLVFNQSDSSEESRQLVNRLLQTHEFAAWSTTNVVKMEVDFPRYYRLSTFASEQNRTLLKKYRKQVQSFPTLLLIQPSGEVLGIWTYRDLPVSRFIDQLDMMLPVRKRVGDKST